MKILFCCESYWPHRGGVQEVIRQIAERMAAGGHDVAVATKVNRERRVDRVNGVRIHSFDIGGNLVTGIRGEVERYRRFITEFDGDAILIKAAQQWSFDALWPVLDQVRARKIFVPCGFSGFFEPDFADYFAQMPDVLRKFDHLIFYAERYRDIDFARAHGITDFSVIPNGASEIDFGRPADGSLRAKLGIAPDDFLLLTVGAPINAKGHEQVREAFAQMDTGGRNATLILNGNWPSGSRYSLDTLRALLQRFVSLNSMRKGIRLFLDAGLTGVWNRLFPKPPPTKIEMADEAKSSPVVKRVLCLDLPRPEVVEAFLEADLFVFASKVEYSPLVLFEAAAAGTPFITVPVGNATEIVHWTGGGWVCPAEVDERGYTKVAPASLAREMEKAIGSPQLLQQLGAAGQAAWRDRFNWAKIAQAYERVLRGEKVAAPLTVADAASQG